MKKLLSLALVLATVLTISVTASAKDITGESGTIMITYTADASSTEDDSYIVTIPDNMTLGTDATVSVKDVVLSAGKQLTVRVSSDNYNNNWRLSGGADDYLRYSLKIDGTELANNGTVLTVGNGETATKTLKTALTDTPTRSGVYADMLTFTVSVTGSSGSSGNGITLTAGNNGVYLYYPDQGYYETLDNVTFTVTYSNGSTETISYDDDGLVCTAKDGELDTNTTGFYYYTASYQGAECEFCICVYV